MEKLEASQLDSRTGNEGTGKLYLSEEEGLAKRRYDSDNIEPIYLVFSPGDRDNPRNWGVVRKYYVAGFTSWLNVLT